MMQRKIYRFFASSLANRLILLMSCCMLVLIFVVTWISYLYTVSHLTRATVAQQNSALSLVHRRFTEYVDELANYSLDIRRNPTALAVLERGLVTHEDRVQLSNAITSLYHSRETYGDIERVEVVMPGSNTIVQIDNALNKYIKIYPGSTLKSLEEADLLHKRGYYAIHYVDDPSYDDYLLAQRAILSFSRNEPLAYVVIHASTDYLKSLFTDLCVEEGSAVLLRQNDAPFFSSEGFVLAEEVLTGGEDGHVIAIDGEAYYAFLADSPDGQWTMVKLLPVSVVTAPQQQIRNVSILVGLVVWLLSVPVSMLIIRRSTSRLKYLSTEMRAFGSSQRTVMEPFSGSDEIAQLSSSFTDMAMEINSRIESEYKLEIAQQKAIVEMLRAQIDPHFLYNSLQTISTQALLAGATDAADMIDGLAMVFRYGIKGKDPVRLSDEVTNAENYVALYKARFAERLEVSWDVDECMLHIEVPKLILMEMIQNSIRYAVEKTYDTIHIQVRAHRTDDVLRITVQDDGPGLPAEVTAELNTFFSRDTHGSEPGHSGGLRNLLERLRIMYPKKVSVLAQNNGGACITLSIQLTGNVESTQEGDVG